MGVVNSTGSMRDGGDRGLGRGCAGGQSAQFIQHEETVIFERTSEDTDVMRLRNGYSA